MAGWLVNDRLSCIQGSRTLWHLLLECIPGLEDRTGVPYTILAERMEALAAVSPPDYIIRNAAYFRPLALSCPQIVFAQDPPSSQQTLEVCSQADVVVFNSQYTKSLYGLEFDGPVIPIGVDKDQFSPGKPADVPLVLFVGSTHPIKGWERFLAVAESRPDLEFVAVLKNDVPRMYRNYLPNLSCSGVMPQRLLAELMRTAHVGICTSEVETQHLAGIEMGLCGVPMVTTNVGVYWNREPGDWGEVVHDVDNPEAWARAIGGQLGRHGQKVADCWKGYTEQACAAAWRDAVESVCVC